MVFKIKKLNIKILLILSLVLPNNLKSQNDLISDSTERINPMDIFKIWQNQDTIRIKYESSGCRYYAETIELIKNEIFYIANVINLNDSIIGQKQLSNVQLVDLKGCIDRVLLKPRGETCLQNHSLTFCINGILYSKYYEEDDCRMNSFWEIKKTVFEIKD